MRCGGRGSLHKGLGNNCRSGVNSELSHVACRRAGGWRWLALASVTSCPLELIKFGKLPRTVL